MSYNNQIEGEKGIPVLKLPARGDQLLSGRQYYLDPIARACLKEEYGLVLPREIECLHAKRAASRITSHNENLETGEVRTSVMEVAAQLATFRCFISLNNIKVFTLDLEHIHSLKPFYAESHKAAEFELEEIKETKKTRQPKAPKPLSELLALCGLD